MTEGVFAVMRDGRELRLAAKHGKTIPQVMASLTSGSLTGSAVPLADAELELDDGTTVQYADINTLLARERIA